MVFGTPKSNQDWGWSRTIKHRSLFYMYILSDTILPCNVSIQRSGINLWHYSTLLHNCKGRVKCWILDCKASCKKKINTDMLVYFYKSVLYSITVTGVSCHWKIKTFDRSNVTFTFWSFKLTEAQSSELFCTKFIWCLLSVL